MSDTQWRRVDEIEGYKQKTFNLSRTDRIGRLITKTYDLMQTIIRDGPNAETLIYDVESLKTEQANAMKWDANQSDLFRSILYDLSSSVSAMIESIQERNKNENLTENYFQGTTDNTDEFTADSSPYQGFMSEFDVKTEPIDPQEDCLFSKFDEKPRGIFDTVSQNSDDVIVVVRSVMEAILDKIATDSDNGNADVNTKEDNGTLKVAPEIRKSSRKIVPKVTYEAEEVEKDSDEDPLTPSTPTTPCAGNYNCDHCERQFNSLVGLKCHRMIHEGFQCGDCGIRMKTKEVLRKHYAEFHPGKRAEESYVARHTCTDLYPKSTPKYNNNINYKIIP